MPRALYEAPKMMNAIKRLLGRGNKPTGPKLLPRDEAMRSSVDEFWRGWFETKGAEWPNDYRMRMDPDMPLNVELAQHAEKLAKETIDILDVGAGPVTTVGKVMPGKTIKLTPTDVVAADYDRLIDEFKAPVPVRTIYADAEKLAEKFGKDSFDIVFAQNCVDHMERPLLAIDGMIDCCRPGGLVFLRHQENEGKSNNYSRLHHWDFFLDDATQHFKIRHVHGELHDISERTKHLGTSRVYRVGKRFVWEFVKA
jgi:SAM-dependent methyltransferase